MTHKRIKTGSYGEELAAKFLRKEGLKIIMRNYRCSLGEMDIIAQDNQTLVFAEVRTRSTGRMGWGEESINYQKRLRLQKIATYFIKEKKYKNWPQIRIDCIAIRTSENQGKTPEIRWIKGI
ncbi:MAG: YraN family protein [Desulfitobacterium sp.]|nr:YraN family protein [Desulfitobacterium sp.]